MPKRLPRMLGWAGAACMIAALFFWTPPFERAASLELQQCRQGRSVNTVNGEANVTSARCRELLREFDTCLLLVLVGAGLFVVGGVLQKRTGR